jgi:hypothetical protein
MREKRPKALLLYLVWLSTIYNYFNSIFSLVIYKYILNTNKISIRLSGLVVLIKALNAIYKGIFLLILGSLTIII